MDKEMEKELRELLDRMPKLKPRDPERIEKILDLLKQIWTQETDNRLSQLLINLVVRDLNKSAIPITELQTFAKHPTIGKMSLADFVYRIVEEGAGINKVPALYDFYYLEDDVLLKRMMDYLQRKGDDQDGS